MTGRRPSREAAVWTDPFFRDRWTRRLVFGALFCVLAIFGFVDLPDRLATGPDARHKSDFSCYVAAAAALATGDDPYAVTNPRGWRYLYPPLLALLLMPLWQLPLTLLGLGWFALSVAAAAGTYLASLRLGGKTGRGSPRWLALLPVLAVAPPAVSALQFGQVSLLLMFLQVFGLRLILSGPPVLGSLAGGAALAAAAAIKIVPLLPAAILLVGLLAAAAARRDPDAGRRASGAAGGLLFGLALLLWVLPSVALGPARNAALLGSFLERVVLNPRLAADSGITASASSNVSALNASRRARGAVPLAPAGGADPLPVGPEGPAETAGLLGLGLLLLAPALALALRAGREGDPVTLAASFGLTLVAGLLLSPLTWSHQLVQLVPAIGSSAQALLDRGRDRAALLVAAAPAALIWLARAHRPLAQSGFLGLGLAAWTAGTLALLLHDRNRARSGTA